MKFLQLMFFNFASYKYVEVLFIREKKFPNKDKQSNQKTTSRETKLENHTG